MYRTISILGGDMRQLYMSEYLLSHSAKANIHIKCHQTAFPENEWSRLKKQYPDAIRLCKNFSDVFQSNVLVCPVPFTKDHVHITKSTTIKDLLAVSTLPEIIFGASFPSNVTSFFYSKGSQFVDFMKEPDFLSTNSELTAEGLLKSIIENTDFSIRNAKILLTGYGWCGKAIARKLSLLGGKLSVFDKEESAMTQAEKDGFSTYPLSSGYTYCDFDIIINTVASPIFKAPFLRTLSSHCALFDIASAPGGFDHDICAGLGINVITCPAIPGKTAPKSAGIAMGECIIEHL